MSLERSSTSSPWPRFTMRTLLLAMVVIAIVFAVAAYFQRQAALREARLVRLEELLDRKTTSTIVRDVEAIRAKLGRAPKDEVELETLLGRSLPVVHDHGHPTPINYRRTGANSFILQYELWATDDWIYDSTIPQAGWVQHYY